MAAAVASSHSHSRPAACNPVASPLSNDPRVLRLRVNPRPACAARTEDAASSRRHCHRADDEKPRGVMGRRRRRRDDDRDASRDRKRPKGSDARAHDHYRRDDDDAHHRGRDGAHRAADKNKEDEQRDRAREDTRRRRSSSRSSRERRARREYPSAAHHHPHGPAAQSIARPPLAADELRKLSPEKEGEDAEARRRRDELQRMREEARRELDKVVRTVWFNDPYISPACMLNTMPRWSLREVEEGEVV